MPNVLQIIGLQMNLNGSEPTSRHVARSQTPDCERGIAFPALHHSNTPSLQLSIPRFFSPLFPLTITQQVTNCHSEHGHGNCGLRRRRNQNGVPAPLHPRSHRSPMCQARSFSRGFYRGWHRFLKAGAKSFFWLGVFAATLR